jgi:nudix-type nucleoside diphosphatase (YffH/AdpP family)
MAESGESPAEIRQVETLAESWKPLRRYTLEYRRRDGTRQAMAREVYCNGPGVAVLPFDPARGTVILIRQFRLPAQVNGDPPFLIEAPAGNVEPGDSPAETARKEAEQEIGYRLEALRQLFALYTSPGTCAEVLHFFLAEYSPAARTGRGGGVEEEGEEIAVLELPLDRAWEMVRMGEIRDAKTVLLLQHLLLQVGEDQGPTVCMQASPHPGGRWRLRATRSWARFRRPGGSRRSGATGSGPAGGAGAPALYPPTWGRRKTGGPARPRGA